MDEITGRFNQIRPRVFHAIGRLEGGLIQPSICISVMENPEL